jgi:DNA integrity scanning protein DisA with diadenylate cyclase activity
VSDSLADTFVDALAKAARTSSCDRVVVVGDASAALLKKLKQAKTKVICAVADPRQHADAIDAGFAAVAIPNVRGSRTDRMKSALVAAMNAGFLSAGQTVACGIVRDDGVLDMIAHLTAEDMASEHASLQVASLRTRIPAPLLEVLVDLALRIGREGYEGRPVGTLIVVGDSTKVLEQSAPLTLNPFQGYSEQERNLFDQEVRSAVRTFAMLDGAFVVREDGVVLAAGRHIRVETAPHDLPLGYGARHVAAAAVTIQTEALAIAVSQSSGKVRVFDKGHLVLELDPGGRRGTAERVTPRPGRPPRVHGGGTSEDISRRARTRTRRLT